MREKDGWNGNGNDDSDNDGMERKKEKEKEKERDGFPPRSIGFRIRSHHFFRGRRNK